MKTVSEAPLSHCQDAISKHKISGIPPPPPSYSCASCPPPLLLLGILKVMRGEFDPMASSLTAFLKRDLEVWYVTTNVTFFSGLLTFIAAMALHSYAFFPGALGAAAALAWGSVAALLVTVAQCAATYDHGFAGMAARCLVLLSQQLTANAFGVLAMAVAAGALVCCAKATLDSTCRPDPALSPTSALDPRGLTQKEPMLCGMPPKEGLGRALAAGWGRALSESGHPRHPAFHSASRVGWGVGACMWPNGTQTPPSSRVSVA